MRRPVRARHSSASSQGQGAAPDTAKRRLATSSRVKPGVSRSRRNIVATPGKTVTRCSRIVANALSGENRSRMTTVAPAISGASSVPLIPYEWERGNTLRTRSAGESASIGPAHA